MLFDRFASVQTFYPPCRPGEAQWINLTASVLSDISEVFPYLNATIQGAIYDPNGRTITFKLKGHGVTLHPHEIAITKSQNPAEAEGLLEEIKELLNSTYRSKDRITPSYRTRAQLRILDVYRLLPRSNCGQCGEATCMAFAARLVKEEMPLSRCAPLSQQANAESRRRLLDLFKKAGYTPEL